MPQHESVLFSAARAKRELIAALLRNGPLPLKVIALRLKLAPGTVTGLLRHPWFVKTGPGHKMPYRLTNAKKPP